MLSRIALLILACSPGWTLSLDITSQPPLPPPNLIRNPGIEEGANGLPADWKWGTAVPENFETAWADGGRSGKCLYLKAASGIMSGYWSQSVRVEPATEYVLTAWLRLGGGKILCYVHGSQPDGRTLDQRYYAASMRNHFLVPVFLKPEYMAGLDATTWHPLRIAFTTGERMEWVAVSAGMYFQAGEAWYDDFRLIRAKADLTTTVQAEQEGLRRVRVLKEGMTDALLDSGDLAPDATAFERSLPGLSTEAVYVLEVTTRDGQVHTKRYPEEVAR